jgi:hypothetical protein
LFRITYFEFSPLGQGIFSYFTYCFIYICHSKVTTPVRKCAKRVFSILRVHWFCSVCILFGILFSFFLRLVLIYKFAHKFDNDYKVSVSQMDEEDPRHHKIGQSVTYMSNYD